ncbi:MULTISPECIES: manganese-dependent inorganic pyrophosphatase [unclassified Moraxella]|uniref:manganese-dependent inorganic pyrophosphatase n=1 Tax=unclassified Moraxella TaxID=2685852 RepID=UPI003AF523DB
MTANIAVFGHKTPDTDAIVSAIAMSYWLNQQDIPATPYRLGDLNQETKFLLNLAHVRTPDLISQLPQNTPIALVDHNESQQSIDNREHYELRYVIDHHKLGDLTSSEPFYLRLQPVGSTATLLYLMFQEMPIDKPKLMISQQIALLMLGAIVSDTLNLTSPTTTDSDKTAVADLSHLAGVHDVNDFAQQLFEAKSDVSHLTDLELITSDYKQFSFGKDGKKWGISAIETVKPQAIFERLATLPTAMTTLKQRNGVDFVLVMIVDIIKQQSWAVAFDDEQNYIVTQAFSSEVKNNLIDLGSLVSRKKQFVPALERFYQI